MVESNKIVEKKILPEYFEEVKNGNKTFEIRKDEDNIQVGDKLCLKEWDGNTFTGRKLWFRVSYVLRNAEQYGLMNSFCVIGLKEM